MFARLLQSRSTEVREVLRFETLVACFAVELAENLKRDISAHLDA